MTLYQTEYNGEFVLNPELYLSPNGRYVLLNLMANSFSTVLLGDLKEDEFECIEQEASGILSYAWNEDSSAYACGRTGLIVVNDTDNEEILTIDTNGRNPMALKYYDDELLVVYSVGILARYDEEGNLLSEAQLDCYAITAYDPISFFFGKEVFIVTVDSFSNVFSLETFEPRTYIYNLDAYVPDKDLFICHGYKNGKVFGYFENLSIEELIEMGYDYINVEQDS